MVSSFVVLVLAIFFTSAFVHPVFAQTGPNTEPTTPTAPTTVTYTSPIKATDFPTLLSTILKTLVYFGVSVLTIFIIYSGFLFIKAQGNPEELKKARDTLLWTLIGGAILIGASVLAKIIETTVKSLD